MDDPSSLWISLAPGVAILSAMLLALLVFVIRQPKFEQNASRTSGSSLLPTTLIRYGYWLADGSIKPLSRLGVRPNHVTLLSVVLSAVSAVLIAQGYLMSAAWVFFGAMACDLIDGLLARSLGMQSSSGAFFDSFCDRISEAITFGGLIYLGRDGLLFGVSFWALVASFMISYARGRGEALGVDCKAGLMQRPERMLTLFFTLLTAPLLSLVTAPMGLDAPMILLAGVGLIALLSTLTAGRRAIVITRELRRRDAQAASAPTNPAKPPSPNPQGMAQTHS